MEKTRTDLTNTKSELDKVKGEVSDLKARIEKAAQYVDVLNGFFLEDSNYTQHKRRVDRVNDAELSALLDKYENSDDGDDDAYYDYLTYIIETALDLLD